MNNRIVPIYMFVLNHGGLVQEVMADLELIRIAECSNCVTREFLQKHGQQDPWDKAPKTSDGYAHIYRSFLGDTKSPVLWTYHFDGEKFVREHGGRPEGNDFSGRPPALRAVFVG